MPAKDTLRQLVAFLETAPIDPGGEPPTEKLEPLQALAGAHDPGVRALMDVVIGRWTSFCFEGVEIFPAVFTRRPWKENIATDDDLCIAKNRGGDLYLWNAPSGAVRLVVHDEGWVTRRVRRSVDVWLTDALEHSLQAIELDEVDALAKLGEPAASRLRFAVDVAADALDDEVREALAKMGIAPRT